MGDGVGEAIDGESELIDISEEMEQQIRDLEEQVGDTPMRPSACCCTRLHGPGVFLLFKHRLNTLSDARARAARPPEAIRHLQCGNRQHYLHGKKKGEKEGKKKKGKRGQTGKKGTDKNVTNLRIFCSLLCENEVR